MTARLAVLRDFRAEGWPSMDLCADRLAADLPAADPAPPFRRVFSRLPHPAAFNADRLLNRHLLYPLAVARLRRRFDLFHVADHSYAQLVHSLPADRTGVYCHDLDAFRCLFAPAADPRPRWFRAIARRVLTGMQQAAVVFHSTLPVRDEIVRYGLLDPAKLVHAPYGVSDEFAPGPPAAVPWLDRLPGRWLLHVGSCIPRKRIDVLLDVFAAVRRVHPDVRLVKIGGDWTAVQREQIERLELADAIVHAQGVPRAELAEAYRRAAAVLVPSDAEGFGLPVIEALACGAAVVASDLPVLREVGGPAAAFRPVADVPAWADAVSRLLAGTSISSPTADRLAWAARFTWAAHADTVRGAYARLAGSELLASSSSSRAFGP